MRGRRHLSLRPWLQARAFATSYTARVVRADQDGRSFAIEVEPLSLLRDVRGYALPRRDLICRVSKILHSYSPTSDPFLQLSDYLETLTVTLSSSEVSEILKSLKSPDKALQFFHFASTSLPGFRHDCFTYNRMLTILSKSDQHRHAVVEIVEDMERKGVRGNISTINILIGIVTGGQELEKCVGLAKKWDLKFNCYSYKCLLQLHIRSREVEKAYKVYEEMRRRGYKLDIFTYNMLLDGLSKGQSFERACKVFADMKRRHCEPNEYTYTILIRMAGSVGKSEELLPLYNEMITKGGNPGLIAYNTMIEALGKNQMIDKMISLFTRMVEKSCRPNEFTYSVIVHSLATVGQVVKMFQIVEVSKKCMNKSIYGYLVKTLSKLGHASEAHRIFCDMWNCEDKGDRDAYLSILESLCSAEKTTEAMELLSKIHEKGLTTDTVMYNTVFTTLGKLRQISYIHALYEQMEQEGPMPDVFTYNILISSFGKAGLVDDAFRVFEEMESKHCKPDVITYNSLINCLGKNGDVDEAHMRFKEMQERGLNPDVVTYSTLIECFGRSNKVEMACRLFDEMLAQGCSPNIVTYNILLDCLERCGKTDEAFKRFEQLKHQCLTPDSITYSILDRLQSRSHRIPRVRKKRPISGWIVSPLG